VLFSKFDIWHGYYNIWLAEEDRHKAAIQTHHGTYIPQVMYFGLCNAPLFFQRTMRNDFAPFLEQYRENAGQYMDDWWMATKDDEEGVALYKKMIHTFLNTCEKKSYFLKVSKCEIIMRPQTTLLGWLVTGEGLKIDLPKVTGISEWPRMLTSVKQVRKTLGVLGYQWPFIQGFAQTARPLTELTKKTKPFEWTDKCREALETLIHMVTSAPVLAFPDLEHPFVLRSWTYHFLSFSSLILSHLLPSPSMPFPYVPFPSTDFRTFPLPSRSLDFVFPSVAVFS
jgi:hypothetical protein